MGLQGWIHLVHINKSCTKEFSLEPRLRSSRFNLKKILQDSKGIVTRFILKRGKGFANDLPLYKLCSLSIYIDTCTNTYRIYIESILDKMFMNENANKIPLTTNGEAVIPNWLVERYILETVTLEEISTQNGPPKKN